MFLLLLTGVACDHDLPTLQISNVTVYRPTPGGTAAVAYFRIDNRGNAALRLDAVTSPQYAKVAMHETVVEDGVARMRPLASTRIDARSDVSFESGGKHLMLMQPREELTDGAPVSLEFHFASGDLMIVDTTLRSRTGS